MKVIKKLNGSQATLKGSRYTKHFSERVGRIERMGGNVGNVAACFLVDKGHANGCEKHFVTDKGAVIVQNAKTRRLVTIMIARSNQIKRYYDALGYVAPSGILKVAEYNSKVMHWNY